jgi:hypothetical protein
MQSFLTDSTNFAAARCLGARIVPGVGLKADFDELPADSATLAVWHLHDGGCAGQGSGLDDPAAGHTLVNQGATAAEDGYLLVASGSQRLYAAFPGQPQRSQLTLECWVRAWQNPAGAVGVLATYYLYYGQDMDLLAYRGPTPAASFLAARCLYGGGSTVVSAQWTGADVDALLASSQPLHVAAVLDAPSRLSLFVNGTRRAQAGGGISPLPAGDYKLWLGCYGDAGVAYASAVLDEVRLSNSVRYAADFTPTRLLSGGTYTSPAFDTLRIGCLWVDLIRTVLAPTGTAAAWQVRAADAVDSAGDPQAAWQPCPADAPTLPRGRYLQWRATLSATADRTTSPTVQSADARASDAGYNVYHAAGAGPDALTYAEPWQRVGPAVTHVATDALAPGEVHWFAVRPVDAAGDELPVAQDELRMELDAGGAVVPPRPAAPLSLVARAAAGGAAQLMWRYRVGRTAVTPQEFRIFGDGGSGTINYAAAMAVVPHAAGQSWFAWTSSPLAGGVHQFAVRAVAAGGTWDDVPAVASVALDAAPPAPVDALLAETIL